MPAFLEAISEVLPLTYLLDVIRATFIAGEGLESAGGPLAAVAVWGLFGLIVAVRMFRWEPREGISGT
jgi:ABC-type multidrug transport system permease subunit